jgi:hypothetical protein
MANSFRKPEHVEHTIVDANNKVVGHIRLKPNKVLWSPAGTQGWYGVSLKDFAAFVLANGSKQAM